MTGRLLTGAVGEVAGWRWALAASGLLAVACALAVRVLLPASAHFVPSPPGLRLVLRRTVRAVSDPALLALYGIGGCSMGMLVAVFNTLGFRLEAAPFHLGLGAASLVFLVYPLGTVSSAVSGRMADQLGRRAVLPVGCLIALAGLLLTLAHSLVMVVVGLGLLVAGFFVVHGIASGWVPVRAHAGGVSAAQAASLYLFAYYLGSSLFGSVAGPAWSSAGWSGVVVLAALLLAITAVLAAVLRRTPPIAATPARAA
jgi:YNFM family putative membrane transporter